MVAVWLGIGLLLLLVETQHRAFFAVFGAAGAFIAAAVAGIAPHNIAVQIAAAAVVTTIGILLLRPRVTHIYERRDGIRPGRGVHGTLIGEEVLTVDVIGDAQHLGHVRLAGERWLAASATGHPIAAGSTARVTGVRGTTLTVDLVDASWPTHPSEPPLAPTDLPHPTEQK